MMPHVFLLAVAVTYESDFSALNFVESLSKAANGIPVDIILVDNTEREGNNEFFNKVQSINPNVICIAPHRNLGYFGGAHFGIREYLEKHSLPAWIMVSNVDLDFPSSKMFSHLVNIGGMESVGVVAPSIHSDHWHGDRNPKMVQRPSPKSIHKYRRIYRNYYLLNLYQLSGWLKAIAREFVDRFSNSALNNVLQPREGGEVRRGSVTNEVDPQLIYAPHGSCIFFSQRFFLRGGNLDYPSFLFGEEIYVAETTRKLGLDVLYYPELKIIHHDHVSTGVLRSRKIASYMYDSAVFLSREYFN